MDGPHEMLHCLVMACPEGRDGKESPVLSVVDDDESVRESVPDLIEEFGFAARAFASAEEFLSSGSVDETSCLILDVAMPGMSGPELQKELKRRGQEIPIIFITGQRDEAIRDRVLDQGAAGFLLKPFSHESLLAAIKTALHGRLRFQPRGVQGTRRATVAYEMAALPTSSATPIVFIVDDDVSVRESLELLVRNENWKPETFASAQEFLDHPRTLVPSCLVLDLSLPDLNGLELQKQLALEHIDMPIIFITGYGDVPKSVQAMKAGALEFLTKPLDNDALVSAIRNALQRSRLAIAQDAEMHELRDRYASLTPREQEVMALVVSGLLNKQVGGELGISEITVKAHRRQVMHKMKANSLAELVKVAAKLGLARPAIHVA